MKVVQVSTFCKVCGAQVDDWYTEEDGLDDFARSVKAPSWSSIVRSARMSRHWESECPRRWRARWAAWRRNVQAWRRGFA